MDKNIKHTHEQYRSSVDKQNRSWSSHPLGKSFSLCLAEVKRKKREEESDSIGFAHWIGGSPLPQSMIRIEDFHPSIEMMIDRIEKMMDYVSSQEVHFLLDPSVFGRTSVRVAERYGMWQIFISSSGFAEILVSYIPLMLKRLLRGRHGHRRFHVEVSADEDIYLMIADEGRIEGGRWLSLR